jgi:hypothetical protein
MRYSRPLWRMAKHGGQPPSVQALACSVTTRQPAKVAPFAGVMELLSEKAPQATFSRYQGHIPCESVLVGLTVCNDARELPSEYRACT